MTCRKRKAESPPPASSSKRLKLVYANAHEETDTSTQIDAPSNVSPFLKLPGEVRNMIYRYLFDLHKRRVIHKPASEFYRTQELSRKFGLLLVSKQCHQEVGSLMAKTMTAKLRVVVSHVLPATVRYALKTFSAINLDYPIFEMTSKANGFRVWDSDLRLLEGLQLFNDGPSCLDGNANVARKLQINFTQRTPSVSLVQRILQRAASHKNTTLILQFYDICGRPGLGGENNRTRIFRFRQMCKQYSNVKIMATFEDFIETFEDWRTDRYIEKMSPCTVLRCDEFELKVLSEP